MLLYPALKRRNVQLASGASAFLLCVVAHVASAQSTLENEQLRRTVNADLLPLLLREEGYEVRGVHRGGEVLQAIFQFAPDRAGASSKRARRSRNRS